MTSPIWMDYVPAERDPNKLNEHLQVGWETIIAEPEGMQTPKFVWKLTRAIYTFTSRLLYTILSTVIGIPCSLGLGCIFACITFDAVWRVAPCLRCVKICLASYRNLVQSCLEVACVPCFEACGHVFRHIRINFRTNVSNEDVLNV